MTQEEGDDGIRLNPDHMRIPEYVKRELSEVYLLMDHIAGRADKTLDEALAPNTNGAKSISLEQICGVAWPPTDQNRAEVLALVLTAKDRLARAAFPASGHSVAFTYLSVTTIENMRHWRGFMSSWASRLLVRFSGDGHGSESADKSMMIQFARDAFPGLERWNGLLGVVLKRLMVTLLTLLFVTCAISWDLAIGQRLLSDYRWLSSHPEVMQPSQQLPPSCPDSSKIVANTPCARFAAFLRLDPIMTQWNNRQIVLNWYIHGIFKDSDDGVRQGYTLEVTRVLVTTLNYDVLPAFLGALAATTAALRLIARKIAERGLEVRDLKQVWERVLLGAVLGAVIGLLISPGASNGLFTESGLSANTSDTVALAPPTLAFVAGFATRRIFQWLDGIVERLFKSAEVES